MIAFHELLTACRTAKSVQKFIEGDLLLIVSAIGDLEYKSAATVLQKLPLANNKRHHVLLAVGHLQSAHVAYREIHADTSGWRGYFTLASRITALHKDIFTLSLMAICYRHLKETGLMRDALVDAAAAMASWRGIRDGYTLGELSDSEKRKTVLSAFGSWLNPGSWPMMAEAARQGFPDIKDEDVRQLGIVLGTAVP